MCPADSLLQKLVSLSQQLIVLASEGNVVAEDDGCRLLFGITRDCAYKIKHQAIMEQEEHQRKGPCRTKNE